MSHAQRFSISEKKRFSMSEKKRFSMSQAQSKENTSKVKSTL